MNEEDLEERLAPPPEEDMCSMKLFEVHFGLRVSMTDEQHRRLLDLMEEIIKAPYNQPVNGIHWMSGGGSRPNWAAVDAAIEGSPVEEPAFDHNVYQLISTARSFVSERERLKVEKERASVGTCSICRELQFPTPSGPICKNGHGGAPSV